MARGKGKLSKGQPAGARSASGRLRNREPRRVEPNDGVLRKRAYYGIAANDGNLCDAIGRAYHAGLLGTGDRAERADRLLAAARRIGSQYWIAYGFGTPDSLARFQPVQPGPSRTEAEQASIDRIREQALSDGLALVRAEGHDVRRAFDQLVIDMHPDHGPAWLDRIIYAQRTGKGGGEADTNMLRLALIGLEAIA